MAAAPCHCDSDRLGFPSFGPCPVHGSKFNRDELRMLQRANKRLGDRLDLCERALRLILAPHGLDVSDRIRDIAESALLPTERTDNADG